jgi:hypothetical protein
MEAKNKEFQAAVAAAGIKLEATLPRWKCATPNPRSDKVLCRRSGAATFQYATAKGKIQMNRISLQ